MSGAAAAFLASLSPGGAIVSGIDRSDKCIVAAQNHAVTSGFKIDYRQGFAENMPYDDNTFDVVICVDVLEHVARLQKGCVRGSQDSQAWGTVLF